MKALNWIRSSNEAAQKKHDSINWRKTGFPAATDAKGTEYLVVQDAGGRYIDSTRVMVETCICTWDGEAFINKYTGKAVFKFCVVAWKRIDLPSGVIHVA